MAKKMIAFGYHVGIKHLLLSLNRMIPTEKRITRDVLKDVCKTLDEISTKYNIMIKYAYIFDSNAIKLSLQRIWDQLGIIKVLKIPFENWREHLRKEIFHVFVVSFLNVSVLDKGVYEISKRKRKFFIISLRDVITGDLNQIIPTLIDFAKIKDVINKNDFYTLFATMATKINEMRNPRDVIAFLKLLKIRNDIASSALTKRAEILFKLHKPFIVY